MELRQHNRIRERRRRQPYYYSRWYRCSHTDCRTREVMPPEFIVWNDNPAARRLRQMREIQKQLHVQWEDL
jgi:hypothetical protein